MGLYAKYVLPKVIHLTCSARPNRLQRAKLIPRASGRVLEIGIGSGLNLPFYDAKQVTKVIGLDPAPEIRQLAEQAARGVSIDVELIGAAGEEVPLDDRSIDTVVVTYTLCSIPAADSALRQMARVLKPGGRLLFCEHGLAPDPGVRRWQHRLNPLWSRLGGGCRLDRDIPDLIERAGFRIADLEARYIPGWRFASFNYWGSATPG